MQTLWEGGGGWVKKEKQMVSLSNLWILSYVRMVFLLIRGASLPTQWTSSPFFRLVY